MRSSVERLADLGRRSRQVLVISAVTGVVIGAATAAFDLLTVDELFGRALEAPLALQMVLPGVGLAAAALILRYAGAGASPATSDEYIRNFHQGDRMDGSKVLPRIAASIATLGSGNALGYEGPAIYLGAGIGSEIQHWLSRYFTRDQAKVLLVCGAAAGVAAVFKAPATGVVFALEVPFFDDLARRALLPASIAAAAAYVTYALLVGTAPILPVTGPAPFDLPDLGGALVVGVLAGLGARGFAMAVGWVKARAAPVRPAVRIPVAGLLLAGLVLLSHVVFEAPLSLGPGYDTMRWLLNPDRALILVLLLAVVRPLATLCSVGGGGAGGLFIPLAVQGALLGRLVGPAFGAEGGTLFPLIGMAAFLGAGYRTPLAAVMFVAESTGRAGFVVPGLIASVVAQLFMGRNSVAAHQLPSRRGHLERRFALPVSSVLRTDVLTVPPDATLAEFFWQHLVGTRERAVAVVEGSRYIGMASVEQVTRVPQEEWNDRTLAEVLRDDAGSGRPDWLVRDAVEAMEAADIDVLAVTDDAGNFVGVVTVEDIVRLDQILGEAGP